MAEPQPAIGVDESEPSSRHIYELPAFWPVAIFLLTLATHGFYIAEMAGHPFFNFPLVDSDTYHRQALDILRNGWVGERIFWQAPLYPYFLALCYHFITVKFFDIRVIQAVLAAINGVLLYEMGRRKLGRGVGIGAAVAAAFYGPLIYYDAEMLAPVLIVFFYLLLALVLDRAIPGDIPASVARETAVPCLHNPQSAIRNPQSAIRKHLLWWPIAGILNGLAALSHGLGLLIAPLVCAYALLGRRMRCLSPARRLTSAGLVILGSAAMIVPVTIRNRLVGGEWVLISHNGPINFYIGNHPDYDRTVGLRPGIEWGTLARDFTDEESSSVRAEARHFTRRTLANIRAHPLAVGRVWLKKLFLFFNADEIKRDYPIYPVRRYSTLMSALMWKWRGPAGWIGLGFPFGVVLPLAAIGWWALRRQGVRLVAVELILAGHFAANMMFFACSRYRIPIAPFLLLYAAAAIQWATREGIWQAEAFRRNERLLAVALAIFLISNSRLVPMDSSEDHAEYEFHLGYVSQHTGKPEQALEHYLAALSDNPDLTEAHFFLGILYQDHLGEPAKALEQFEWVLIRDPDNVQVLFNKAVSLGSLGRTDEARAILEALVANDPENQKYRSYLDQLSGKATGPQSENQTRGQPGAASTGLKAVAPF
jgi:4-amino-4-deoxy-L-arabinose transferase-like glycosyltransferase